MNIKEINPAEFGAAIGHVAAGQLFGILGYQPEAWISPTAIAAAQDALIDHVLELGKYTCSRDLLPGQLLAFAASVSLRTDGADPDEEHARAWAYDVFAHTCRYNFDLMTAEQQRIADAEAEEAAVKAVQPLPLEDSIFENHGSLNDLEGYQQKHLEALEASEQRKLEEAAAASAPDQDASAMPIGEPETQHPTDVPALSIGAKPMENVTDEAEAAATGSEAGNQSEAASPASEALLAAGGERDAKAAAEGAPTGDISTDGEAGPAPAVPGDDPRAESGNSAPAEVLNTKISKSPNKN